MSQIWAFVTSTKEGIIPSFYYLQGPYLHDTSLLPGQRACTVKNTTAGLLISDEPTNNQFSKQPEGLRHFRDHRWKALGKLVAIFV